jgi:hypothetical protein
VCDILILNQIFISEILIQLPFLHTHTHFSLAYKNDSGVYLE